MFCGPMRRSLGGSDGGLSKAVGLQLMASFCAHVLLFNEQMWADKHSVYRGNSAASKVCTHTGAHVRTFQKRSRRSSRPAAPCLLLRDLTWVLLPAVPARASPGTRCSGASRGPPPVACR